MIILKNPSMFSVSFTVIFSSWPFQMNTLYQPVSLFLNDSLPSKVLVFDVNKAFSNLRDCIKRRKSANIYEVSQFAYKM